MLFTRGSIVAEETLEVFARLPVFPLEIFALVLFALPFFILFERIC